MKFRPRFRRRAPVEHVHDYDARGVHRRDIYASDAKGDEGRYPTRRYTTVLWACRGCHERYTQDLEGHWTLEQVCRVRQREVGFMEPWEGYETKTKERR